MEVDVKIKRYMAPSMRVALDQVRAEQGADAVILSSRRVKEGIEVIAAVDYDEALMAGAARQYSISLAAAAPPEPPAPARPEAQASRPETPVRAAGQRPTAAAPSAQPPRPAAQGHAVAPPTRSAVPTLRPTVPAPAAIARPAAIVRPAAAPPAAEETRLGFASMRSEIKDLRRLLESELSQISWNDKRLREPLQARVLEDLSSMDIAPDVAARLAALAPRRTNLGDASNIPMALLLKHLPVVDRLSTVNPGIFALVGPTGAGKTTTIAKLAARWTMRHGSQDLALVSTDAYRIGAREQLMTYARILGASVHSANSGQELARVLGELKSKKLVLIDTAGMGPRDVRLSEQLAALAQGAKGAEFLLALPAQGEGLALEEIIRAFAQVKPTACIITKVDEAASLGAVLSTTLRHKLKIAYLCNGQRVPEDVHPAHHRRVWLVRAAHELTRRAPRLRDDTYFARNFGRATAHA
jgi:flagellar biosynthesis protein FlhF